jgi:hypothetical protein|tara:strand:+ start:98 stop:454 length:357 start_codon:yes stop_codon:yes gene_type:complete
MKSNKIQHTKKALLKSLEKSLGVVTTACKQVGIDRTTFYRYYKEDEEFKKQVDDLSNVAKDFVESQLFKQIQDGVPTSTIFYLKTKAKDRGYIERREYDLSGSVKSKLIEWTPVTKKK